MVLKHGLRKALLTVVITTGLAAFSAAAAVFPGNDQEFYTYSGDKKPIVAPAAYRMETALTAGSLGLDSLADIADVAVRGETLYILDKAKGRIVLVDADYTLAGVLGEDAGLKEPEGFFLSPEGDIYVADTGNARVIKLDADGHLIKVVGAPDPAQTLSTVDYAPSKLAVDAGERLYVLANNETNGIFQLDIDGNFLGFFGSVPVVPDLMELFWRSFSTKEQLARMLLFVPTEYSGIDIDADGFIYTTVATNTDAEMIRFIEGGGKELQLAPIRRLNPKGIDVLLRGGSMPPAGDLITTEDSRGVGNASRFVDVAVRTDGRYSVLDSTRSRVFTYDADGELLYIFGNGDDTKSGLKKPVALCWWGENIAVADRDSQAVKVFAPTAYAALINQAITYDKAGDYEQAKACWNELLSQHSGSSLAYIGLGKQCLWEGRYTQAMDWFRRGSSPENYSKAFRLYRQEIGYMLTGAAICVLAVLVVGLLFWKRYRKKHGHRDIIRSPKIRRFLSSVGYGFHIMRHPFDGFWDMTFEKRGTRGLRQPSWDWW